MAYHRHSRYQTFILNNAVNRNLIPIQSRYNSSSSNFIPNRKQSTAYMSKYTSVNQYTLMFCWWSPEKPMAYLAGNR